MSQVHDLIRLSAAAAQENYEDILESSVDDILGYLSRRTDVSTIRDAMRARFAVGIAKNEAGYEFYSKSIIGTAIDGGLYESVSSGIGNKIINELANLFNLPTQSYAFISPDGEAVEEVAEIINKNRELGNFDIEMILADRISSAIETAPLLIQIAGDRLSYRAFSPACIYPIFAKQILDNGVLRGVDALDIEDATAVVIKLAGTNDYSTDNEYLAIFGRSEELPYGRYVQFTAKNWKNIPRVGDPSAVDYLIDGNPANPLSFMAAKNPDREIPEYPIIFIRGGHSLSREKLIEINSSLYDAAVEIDLGYSRILKDSLSNSTGVKILKSDLGTPLPRSLEGTVVLGQGQTIEMLTSNNSACDSALAVITQISKAVAEGFSVPGYSVTQDGQAQSGISIYLQMAPLVKHRDYRIKLNTPAVNKIFLLEKNLLEFLTGKNFGDVKQIWNPGAISMPETETEKVARLKAALDAKLISYVKAVREFYSLATDADAIAMIEQIRQQEEEYPVPTAPTAALPFGLFPREK